MYATLFCLMPLINFNSCFLWESDKKNSLNHLYSILMLDLHCWCFIKVFSPTNLSFASCFSTCVEMFHTPCYISCNLLFLPLIIGLSIWGRYLNHHLILLMIIIWSSCFKNMVCKVLPWCTMSRTYVHQFTLWFLSFL